MLNSFMFRFVILAAPYILTRSCRSVSMCEKLSSKVWCVSLHFCAASLSLLYFLTSLAGWWCSAKDSDMPGWTHPPQLHRPSMTSWPSTSPSLSGCTFSHISASYVSQLRNNINTAPKRTKRKICASVGYPQNVPWHSLISNVSSSRGINP